MNNVNGKYIWVIGASSGIGLELAKELARKGAILALSARREEKLKKLLEDLSGDKHIMVPLDISDAGAVKNAQKTILKSFPQIDSVICMAAIYSADKEKNTSPDFIQKTLLVNIGGAFNVVESLKPQFKKQGHGQIALCASVAGYRGLPNGQPYSATKAALINYGESLKVELESDNIDVKIICPGFVKTDLTAENDFRMPMIMDADSAAKEIVKGISSNKFQIDFPKRFTTILKVLRAVPYILFFPIARKMR
tara:strand:- start:5399 stop:6154 length:756 start_codon:yes stop_codon:yes gene_type:complete